MFIILMFMLSDVQALPWIDPDKPIYSTGLRRGQNLNFMISDTLDSPFTYDIIMGVRARVTNTRTNNVEEEILFMSSTGSTTRIFDIGSLRLTLRGSRSTDTNGDIEVNIRNLGTSNTQSHYQVELHPFTEWNDRFANNPIEWVGWGNAQQPYGEIYSVLHPFSFSGSGNYKFSNIPDMSMYAGGNEELILNFRDYYDNRLIAVEYRILDPHGTQYISGTRYIHGLYTPRHAYVHMGTNQFSTFTDWYDDYWSNSIRINDIPTGKLISEFVQRREYLGVAVNSLDYIGYKSTYFINPEDFLLVFSDYYEEIDDFGEYNVIYRTKSSQNLVWSGWKGFNINVNELTQGNAFGYIIGQDTINPAIEFPIKNTEVRILPVSYNNIDEFIVVTQTDTDGRYEVDLLEGSYIVYVNFDGDVYTKEIFIEGSTSTALGDLYVDIEVPKLDANPSSTNLQIPYNSDIEYTINNYISSFNTVRVEYVYNGETYTLNPNQVRTHNSARVELNSYPSMPSTIYKFEVFGSSAGDFTNIKFIGINSYPNNNQFTAETSTFNINIIEDYSILDEFDVYDPLDEGSEGYFNESVERYWSSSGNSVVGSEETTQLIAKLNNSDYIRFSGTFPTDEGSLLIPQINFIPFNDTHYKYDNMIPPTYRIDGVNYGQAGVVPYIEDIFIVNEYIPKDEWFLLTYRLISDSHYKIYINNELFFNLDLYALKNSGYDFGFDFTNPSISSTKFAEQTNNYFDDLRTWNRTITTSEMEYIYNEGFFLTYPFNIIYNNLITGNIFARDQNNVEYSASQEIILLVNASNDVIIKQTESDIYGEYVFNNIPPYNYKIYRTQVVPQTLIKDTFSVGSTDDINVDDYFFNINVVDLIGNTGDLELPTESIYSIDLENLFINAQEYEVIYFLDGAYHTLDMNNPSKTHFSNKIYIDKITNDFVIENYHESLVNEILIRGMSFHGRNNDIYVESLANEFFIEFIDVEYETPVKISQIPDIELEKGETITINLNSYYTTYNKVELKIGQDTYTYQRGNTQLTGSTEYYDIILRTTGARIELVLTAKDVFNSNVDITIFNFIEFIEDEFNFRVIDSEDLNPEQVELFFDENLLVGDENRYQLNYFFRFFDYVNLEFEYKNSSYTIQKSGVRRFDEVDIGIEFGYVFIRGKKPTTIENIKITAFKQDEVLKSVVGNSFNVILLNPINPPVNFNLFQTFNPEINQTLKINMFNYFNFIEEYELTFIHDGISYKLNNENNLIDNDYFMFNYTSNSTLNVIMKQDIELSGLKILAINIHGTTLSNEFRIRARKVNKFFDNIFSGFDSFLPQSSEIDTRYKWIISLLMITALAIIPVLIMGASSGVITISLFLSALGFFFFVAIGFIPVGVVISLILIAGAILFIKTKS